MPSTITQNEPLAPYTTLGVGGNADYFASVKTNKELHEVLAWARENEQRITVFGGGSNILVPDAGIRGLVIYPAYTDVSYDEKGDDVFVTAGAGLMLDDLIQELVSKELWGLENLSSIPCAVGGAPVQNVGAYGAEAKNVIHEVHTFNTETLEARVFTNKECEFAYRESIFKKEEGKKYIVTHVVFKVSKTTQRNLSYKDVKEFFGENETPSIQEIRDAVKEIRAAKLPRVKEVGTAGSFFKNPVISKEQFQKLQEKYADMPGYVMDEDNIKISLGWVLDHVCNLKGHTEGNVGLHKKQALVLVCKKGTSSEEIDRFANKIAKAVLEKTGISIEREVIKLS